MTKPLKHRLLCLALLAHFSLVVNAEVLLKGRLLTEQQQPLSNVLVRINNSHITTSTNNQGYYQLTLDKAELYQLNFSKVGYYSSVQTFSHFELAAQAKPWHIADISLVAKAPGRVMLAFTGDTMMGRRYYQPYFADAVLINDHSRQADSRAIIAHMKPYLSLADIASTNLETQVFNTLPGDAAPKSIAFFSKPEILDALRWGGVDYVSLGNNHSYDYKESGLQRTIEHLQQSGLGYSGGGINQAQALQAYSRRLNGVDYGMLGYVGWQGRVQPNQIAEEHKGGAAFGSSKNIITSVSAQIKQGRIPIVQYHGSQEYSNNPTGVTEQRLKLAIDHGAAVAIAHHPHVTQGIELYKGKLIAYSMGNFIFDQYIPSTPYSFVLYVWMDKDQFHRAELVPIYLKGYKPTPATGINRYTSMKRIVALSAQRNSLITLSGGHGIITAKQALPSTEQRFSLSFNNNSQVAPLYLFPWQQQLTRVLMPTDMAYRLGINLINGSDFESFNYFDSPERGWLFDRSNTVINHYGASGTKSLGITLTAKQISQIGMQAFRRLFKGDRPSTVIAKVKTQQKVKISLYWQGRRYGQGFFDALNNSEKKQIGTVQLAGMDSWQSIQLDFNSVRHNYPSSGFRSYRLLADIELLEGKSAKVDIDDFALIEWQSAYSNNPRPLYTSIEAQQASYIGINQASTKPIKLIYK